MNRVFLIDIDGTICDDIKNEESHLYPTAKCYPDALRIINKWYDEGNVITFFTARESKDRDVTETWLRDNGFKYFFNDIRGGLSIKFEDDNNFYFNINTDVFLMLEDYMRDEWVDVDIWYQYGIVRPGSGTIYNYGNTSSTKIRTITEIPNNDPLVYLKFFCSRIN